MFDIGSTTFVLISTALVLLMTPALSLFYGGLACRRNVLSVIIQSFFSMGWSAVLWFVIGYSLCFSGSMAAGTDFFGLIGNLGKMFLGGVSPTTLFAGNGQIPEYAFFAFQMMFSIIAPALITGAFVSRMNFKAYILFLTAWQFLIYYPFCHMVWGGGLLAELGVLDFAGGIVVHVTAGFAALASIVYVGKRAKVALTPNSLPLVAIGTGLLWFGWFGFNAGSALQVNAVAINAFVNTTLAASFALMTWLIIEWVRHRQPKTVGVLTGSIAGLATVTPAAGFVPVWAACIIGIIASVGCYLSVELKERRGWDDALDVWGVHGMGGFIGTILLGVFATTAVNPAGTNGLLFGGGRFFLIQVVATLGSAVYSFIAAWLMLWVVDRITAVRPSSENEAVGLDLALHGEEAYHPGIS